MSDQKAPEGEVQLPDLNREKVINRNNGVPYFEIDDYGTYRLALKQYRFEPGKKNNPHFRADCVVVESTNPIWPVGRECAIHFHTGRPGTTKDPGRPDRDDAYVAEFLRAVFKVARGAAYDNNKALKALLSKGKLPDQSVQFLFVRKPGNTKKVFDEKTEQVNEVTFPKDAFQTAP
jgi:hypothetical protein